MEKKLSNNPSTSVKSLEIKTIKEAARESLLYINGRRSGAIKPMRTPWEKYNKASLGGIEWGTIHTIAGMSGSGKTAMVNALETGLADLNEDEDFSILSFNFEMTANRLVTRKLSNVSSKTVGELYSADNKVSDDLYKKLIEYSKDIVEYDINYVDMPGSAQQIKHTILNFYNKINAENYKNKSDKRKGVGIIIDHVLLVSGMFGEAEREILKHLMAIENELKKSIKCFFVNLSQLNRDIESNDRILNPDLHFPKKKDIFGSDALYQYSDIVCVLHRPEMLGITKYGKQELPVRDLIYLHFLKVRDGEPFIAKMKNELKHNRIVDYKEPKDDY